MENRQEVTLRKIPVKVLIDVLTDAWNKGADFVDIIGIANDFQDNIGIAIKEEYYNKEEEEENFDVEIEIDPSKELNDDDLNQLI
jgi:hypothetical protein|tara:strand:+ start:1155 stop:1409 length:255 start_codon:yes stop_codon:yes gene_type:complete